MSGDFIVLWLRRRQGVGGLLDLLARHRPQVTAGMRGQHA